MPKWPRITLLMKLDFINPTTTISYLNENVYFYQNILRYILYHMKCNYDLFFKAINYIHKC